MKKKNTIMGLLVLIIIAGTLIFFLHDKSNKDADEIQGKADVVENVEEKEDNTENKELPKIEYVNINKEDVNIPILMYHSISDTNPNNNLLIPPKGFEEQMQWLKNNDFTSMTLGEALESMETGKVPKRPVVITFDDGYVDNYISAYPVLKNLGLKGTFFIITSTTDTNEAYMTSDMLKEMKSGGMEIENHTFYHFDLPTESIEKQKESIKKGQDVLREKVGVDSKFLCYPSGKYTEDTRNILKDLGIKGAVTTKGGIASVESSNYELKRVRIFPMSIDAFASKFKQFMN